MSSSAKSFDLAVFRDQLRKGISAYIRERSDGKVSYSTFKKLIFCKQGAVTSDQDRETRQLIDLLFGSKEHDYLNRLIVAVEKIDISYHLWDQVNAIYSEMPKYFSFFYPVVFLSDRIKITLATYPRERLLELELEKNKEHQLACDEKIRNVTNQYKDAVELYEDLSIKLKQFSTIENLEKEELSKQLVSSQTQCEEYRKHILSQEQKIQSLEEDNLSLSQKNENQKSLIDLLEENNKKLQDEIKKLQSSCESLLEKFERCPIKNEVDLELLSQKMIEKAIERIRASDQNTEHAKDSGFKFF